MKNSHSSPPGNFRARISANFSTTVFVCAVICWLIFVIAWGGISRLFEKIEKIGIKKMCCRSN